MKLRVLFILAALFCYVTGYAGNLQVDDAVLKPGDTKDFVISLSSPLTNYVGVQFDVVLPDGFSLENKDDKVYQLAPNQVSDLTCNVSSVGTNTFRFVIYSSTLSELKEGQLIKLNLKANSSIAVGSYDVSVNNILFSDSDGKVTNESGINATLSVASFVPAEQNLKVETVTVKAGEMVPLKISLLESITGCAGVQFDLIVPEGISLEKDVNGSEYKLSAAQPSDMMCGFTAVGDGKYRFVLYSNSLSKFVCGDLMDVYIKTANDMAPGSYPLIITNVLLSDNEGNVYKDNGAGSNVVVPQLYTLTYKVDGEVYRSFQLSKGDIITPEDAPTKEGYVFSGWSEVPETMPAEDVTITGSFAINKYHLIYQVDGAKYKDYEVEYNSAISPEEEPTREGYTFSGWSEIPETMPAEDVTITGTFTINKYHLIYQVDGVEYKNYEVEYNSTISPEAEPTRESYTFSGWSDIPEKMPAHNVIITGSFNRCFTVGSVVDLVNIIMNENATTNDFDLYDLNSDDELNIGDIILVVKWLLNHATVGAPKNARTRSADIADLAQYTATQFDIKTTNNTNIKEIRLVSNMAQTHQLMYQQKDVNTYTVVVYSLSNQLMKPENGSVVEVDTDNGGNSGLSIMNMVVSDVYGGIQPYDGTAFTTNIHQIENNGSSTIVYDLKGNRYDGTVRNKKGIYIINGKKVVVK